MVTRVAEGMLRDARDNIGHLMPATPSPARHRVPEGIDHTHGHGAEGTGHERGVVDGGLDRVPRILCGGDILVAGSETGVTPEPGRVPCGVSVMVAAPAVDPPLTESVALPRGSTRVSSKESAVRVATDGLAMLALVVVTTIRGGPPMWATANSAGLRYWGAALRRAGPCLSGLLHRTDPHELDQVPLGGVCGESE